MKKNEIISYITTIIVFGTIIIYFIMWCRLPNMVPTHFGFACNADAYGHKFIHITYIWLPLIALIPFPPEEPPEVHASDMQDFYKELLEEEKMKAKYGQLMVAIIEAVFMLGSMILLTASL